MVGLDIYQGGNCRCPASYLLKAAELGSGAGLESLCMAWRYSVGFRQSGISYSEEASPVFVLDTGFTADFLDLNPACCDVN